MIYVTCMEVTFHSSCMVLKKALHLSLVTPRVCHCVPVPCRVGLSFGAGSRLAQLCGNYLDILIINHSQSSSFSLVSLVTVLAGQSVDLSGSALCKYLKEAIWINQYCTTRCKACKFGLWQNIDKSYNNKIRVNIPYSVNIWLGIRFVSVPPVKRFNISFYSLI